MKTLIIHPDDRSTDFLSIVYENIKDKTIIRSGLTKEELMVEIEKHDRIMMMGHGSPYGLFSIGKFPNSWGYIIDYTMVKLLNEKTDNVFIWCNADEFVNYHKLKGFYTGMFISEVNEALYCGLPDTTQEDVDKSNSEFCKILSEEINENTDKIFEGVTTKYGKLIENNNVANYNHQRLYKR